MDRVLKLGTRGSPLALAQARAAARRIIAANGLADDAVEIVTIATTGDRIQDRPLADIGGKALWTKELDRSLAEGMTDISVHSMKDVESDRPAIFAIPALLARADPRDRLIGADAIEDISAGARVGTSSPRRAAQLLRLRPDLDVVPMRGNVETRLRKIAAGEVAATFLAAAGLDRLGIDAGSALPIDQFLPAPGQAAIGIECRADDAGVQALLASVGDAETGACVAIERAFTAALGGNCHSPVAALARWRDGAIELRCAVYSPDGSDCLEDMAVVPAGELRVAEAMARDFLARAPASIARLFDAP